MDPVNNNIAFESDLNNGDNHDFATRSNNDHGWQKVTYAKRQRKQQKQAQNGNAVVVPGSGAVSGADNVFLSLEKQTEDRRRRIAEAAAAAAAAAEEGEAVKKTKKKRWGDEETSEEDESGDEDGKRGGGEGGEVKKVKKAKKPKKPKVTVAEAAAKIDVDNLAAFLADISGSYEGQQDIQLMRFADYFGRAFSGVSGAQFPWMKLFRESSVAKIADIPLSHISEAVYKTSVDWINQRSMEALGSFIIWCADGIFADLAGQQAAAKGAKKGVQHASSKSQVAIFVALAMVLRRKPDALVNVLPTLRENPKYQGQDKLPVHIWMITQASQGDLAVGLYAWAHNLLPLVNGKGFNPQSRDLVLQLVERILSAPKARPILKNNAVRKGERLIPPSAFETLLRVTFPAPSARVKATERFEAVYPVLKEVALGGDAKSKAMKQVLQQIMNFAMKAAGEGNPELSKEATGIIVWSLTQNADCYKQWDKLYQDNLEASVAILKKLTEEWKQISANQFTLDPLRDTIKNFKQKNEKALASGDDAQLSLHKDADKYCKVLLGRLSRGGGCVKGIAVAVIALAVGAVVVSPNVESWDLDKLSALIKSHLSF